MTDDGRQTGPALVPATATASSATAEAAASFDVWPPVSSSCGYRTVIVGGRTEGALLDGNRNGQRAKSAGNAYGDGARAAITAYASPRCGGRRESVRVRRTRRDENAIDDVDETCVVYRRTVWTTRRIGTENATRTPTARPNERDGYDATHARGCTVAVDK